MLDKGFGASPGSSFHSKMRISCFALRGEEPHVIVNADAIWACVEEGANEYDTFEPQIATQLGGSLVPRHGSLHARQLIVEG